MITHLWVWDGQRWRQVATGQPAEMRRARNVAAQVAHVLGLKAEMRVAEQTPCPPGPR